jgi:hypothetical protein
MSKIASDADLRKLLECVYELRCKSISYDGKEYFPHAYHEDDTPTRGGHDPDYYCAGYHDHDFRGDDASDSENAVVDLPYTQISVTDYVRIVHNFFEPTDCPFEKIIVDRPILIENNKGVNPDHRGSNHMLLDLTPAFTGKVTIPVGTYTIAQFANLAWRVKGNKFDYHYELIWISDDDSKIIKMPNEWYVTLDVDHGS